MLRKLKSKRWFVPRALDLLAAMADSGLNLPQRAVDPALAAFTMNPDCPPPLDELFVPWFARATDQRAWVADLSRKVGAPTTINGIASLLPQLDVELQIRLSQEGLSTVVENDISVTLPILAKIERRGATVGTPRLFGSWTALHGALRTRATTLTRQLAGLSQYDLGTAPWGVTGEALANVGWVPKSHFHGSLDGEQFTRRLAYFGSKEAKSVLKLRSISSHAGLLYWTTALTTSAPPLRLRGMHVPERTGRWGMARHPLQNIPKHGEGGAALRSGLKPPKGYVLLRADWNSFEARLIAELSGDPVLLQAAQAQDLHAALAQQLRLSRAQAKALFYAILYGQSQAGFFGDHPSLSYDDAKKLYALARHTFKVALNYLDGEVTKQKNGQWLTTPGGFRRRPDEPGQARNFVVQGFGADCIRWVLRRLEQKLQPYRAIIAHQAHDEVLVAVPKRNAGLTEFALRLTMTTELVKKSGLFTNGVPMKVKIEERRTW